MKAAGSELGIGESRVSQIQTAAPSVPANPEAAGAKETTGPWPEAGLRIGEALTIERGPQSERATTISQQRCRMVFHSATVFASETGSCKQLPGCCESECGPLNMLGLTILQSGRLGTLRASVYRGGSEPNPVSRAILAELGRHVT
jgi:hypothetical protein